IQDPTGAVFALWKAGQSMGSFYYGELGAVGWNELVTTDVDRAAQFYKNLFGWTMENQDMGGMTYTTLKKGTTTVGGMMAKPKDMGDSPSAWNTYVSVPDADATV